MTNLEAAAVLDDAELAKADATVIAAALDEIVERVAANRIDATDRLGIVRDVLPCLDALRAYFEELAA